MILAIEIIMALVGLVVIFGVIVPEVRKAIDKLPNKIIDRSDPVTHCQCYVEEGCSHVDGMHCEMRSCGILKEYRNEHGR